MSKLSNTLLLLSYLQTGRKYAVKELAERLEVKPRMIRTYKEDLEKAGFIIESIYGPYGGYILRKNPFEIQASFNEYDLTMVKTLMRKQIEIEQHAYLEILYDKLNIIVSAVDEKALQDDIQKTYNILSRAIKEKKKVEILYNSHQKGFNQRIIDPYELFYLENGFGVAAFCNTKQDLRHFELKRIKKIKLLDKKQNAQ